MPNAKTTKTNTSICLVFPDGSYLPVLSSRVVPETPSPKTGRVSKLAGQTIYSMMFSTGKPVGPTGRNVAVQDLPEVEDVETVELCEVKSLDENGNPVIGETIAELPLAPSTHGSGRRDWNVSGTFEVGDETYHLDVDWSAKGRVSGGAFPGEARQRAESTPRERAIRKVVRG